MPAPGPGAGSSFEQAMISQPKSGFTNLGDLIRRDRDPAKVAIIDLGAETERQCTYAEFDAMANGVARGLAARSLARGERIAILSANRTEFIATLCGIMRAGLVAVPVNFRFPRATIDFILRDAGAKLVFCDGRRRELCPPGIPVAVFRWRRRGDPGLRKLPRSRPCSRRSWLARTSPLCSSTRRGRPGRPRASCYRTRAIFGWWRRGSKRASRAIVS